MTDSLDSETEALATQAEEAADLATEVGEKIASVLTRRYNKTPFCLNPPSTYKSQIHVLFFNLSNISLCLLQIWEHWHLLDACFKNNLISISL